jgi:ABC-2 type transport system permease protein
MSDLWRIGRARVGIELKQFFRDRESALFNFLLPMILLVVFGSVFSGNMGPVGISFAQYFLAGMIASGILYTSFQNLAIAIPMERDDGTLKRLQGLPMPQAAYFAGKVGTVLVAYVAQVIVLLVVGVLFFDITLPTDVTRWVTFAWVSVLGLTAATLLGIAYSAVPRQGKGASAIVAPVVLVLQFTSGVFFVFTDLPEWMRIGASVFPLKWLTQAMRSVFLPAEFEPFEVAGSWELGTTALVLVAWCVIGAVLAVRFFRWTPRGSV